MILVTGCNGLIGSQAVLHYDRLGVSTVGIDANMRQEFFGQDGDTATAFRMLKGETRRFRFQEIDVRDRMAVNNLLCANRFTAVVHCAAQPSHDLAAKIPHTDFAVNAVGTLILLQATRDWSPEAPFVFMSTNKVYGDAPNGRPITEKTIRYDYILSQGITEQCSIDQSLHSLFGVSKLSADLMVQEYGRYFGMKTCCFRAGCLTGPMHAAVEAHGFLAYVAKCVVTGKPYTIYGYKGKQVRDQLHSADMVSAIAAFIADPGSGEVYNIGGGRANAASVLECIAKLEAITGKKLKTEYRDEPRKGDHICYITDYGKFQRRYPAWRVTRSLDEICRELVENAER